MTEMERMLHDVATEGHKAFVVASDLAEQWAQKCRLQTEAYRKLERERDGWQQAAEEIFRMACQVEQERDEADACVRVLSGCLADAEREIEEEAAEMVALRNRADEAVGMWRRCCFDADEAAADYHAAWRDAMEAAERLQKERDDANRALEMEKRHLATARRLLAVQLREYGEEGIDCEEAGNIRYFLESLQ